MYVNNSLFNGKMREGDEGVDGIKRMKFAEG